MIVTPHHRRPQIERRRVLLVDDDLDFLDALGEALTPLYDVVCACDARVALTVLAREPVDVVVLDLTMPGMNVAEFMRHRLARNLATPVIAASARHDIAQRCAELGIERWVRKPFSVPELIGQLRAIAVS